MKMYFKGWKIYFTRWYKTWFLLPTVSLDFIDDGASVIITFLKWSLEIRS